MNPACVPAGPDAAPQDERLGPRRPEAPFPSQTTAFGNHPSPETAGGGLRVLGAIRVALNSSAEVELTHFLTQATVCQI